MDSSFQHLSQYNLLTTDQQLYTGGEYLSQGDIQLALPTDGNIFSLTILNGTVRFTGGTINGAGASEGIGQVGVTVEDTGRRTYAKFGDDWQTISTSGSSGGGGFQWKTITTSATLSLVNNVVWANSLNGALLLSLPVGLPNDATFIIHRRGANNVTVDPGGVEGVVNPATGVSDQTGVVIDKDGGTISLKKTGNNWYVTPFNNP